MRVPAPPLGQEDRPECRLVGMNRRLRPDRGADPEDQLYGAVDPRFEALYERHFRSVLAYCLRRLGKRGSRAAADVFLNRPAAKPPKNKAEWGELLGGFGADDVWRNGRFDYSGAPVLRSCGAPDK